MDKFNSIFFIDFFLAFTTEGNAPYVEGGGINYELIQMSWTTLEEIQKYQSKPYKLQGDWLAEQLLLTRPLRGFDDETLYTLSLKIEPNHSRDSSFSELTIEERDQLTAYPVKRLAPLRRSTVVTDNSDGDLTVLPISKLR